MARKRMLSQNIGNKARILFSPLLFNTLPEVPATAIRQDKEVKHIG